MASVDDISNDSALFKKELAEETTDEEVSNKEAEALQFDKEHNEMLMEARELAALFGANVTSVTVSAYTGERHVSHIDGDGVPQAQNYFTKDSVRRCLHRKGRLGEGTVRMLSKEFEDMKLPEVQKLMDNLKAVRLSALRRIMARKQAGHTTEPQPELGHDLGSSFGSLAVLVDQRIKVVSHLVSFGSVIMNRREELAFEIKML